MKKVILPLAIVAILAGSCTKENISRITGVVSSSTDSTGDDKGGESGGGGGENIPASSVPEAVMNAFKAKYASATNPEWKKLKNGNYKVEFFISGVKWQSIFSASGDLLKEEHL